VAAYRADIEIGVRGARNLEQLRSSINQTAQAVDSLNDVVSARGSLVQNIQNYTNNLDRAARSLRLVGANTEAETKAIREYVRALGEANTARARQNSLVAQEIANQRQLRPGNAGVGQQGPALPPALVRAQEVRQTWNAFFQEASGIAEDLRNTAKSKALNTRTSWNVFFQQASDVAKDLQVAAAQRTTAVKSSWVKFLSDAAQVGQDLSARVAQIRASEGAASQAARERLTQASSAGLGGVARRPIAGAAYTEPAGPGGAGVTRASAVAAEASLRRTLDLQLKTAAAAGSWATALRTGSKWLNEDLDVTAALLRANDGLLKSTNAQISARKQLVKVKQFEEQQSKRAKRTEQLNESIALGVGFPLLFGGGLGSVAGSFAGSFAGQGFGGQIIGGAIGQAVDNFVVEIAKVTSSLETTTKAAGISGTALEANIQALQKAGQEEEALELATQSLARVVGEEGVRALKEFERSGTQLANAFQKLGTQLLALTAQALGPSAQGISGAIEDSVLIRQAERSGDPRQIADIQARNKAFGDEYYKIQERILNRQREINKEFENQNVLLKENANTLAQDKRLLEAQIDLAKTDGDLTNDKVFAIRQVIIQKEFEKALQDAINNGTSSELAQLERKLKLTQLATDRQEALAKAAEKTDKAGRSALDIQRALLSLQSELLQVTLDSGDVDTERARIFDGQSAALKEQIDQAQTRLEIEGRLLNLDLERKLLADDLTAKERELLEAIYRQQKDNLQAQAQLKFRSLQLSLAELDVQNKISELNRARALEDITTNRTGQLGRLQAQLANPFSGDELERANLAFDQLERQVNTLTPLFRELQDLETEFAELSATDAEKRTLADKERLETLTKDITLTQQRIDLEGQYLDQISQTEQALLRQQQIIGKFGFIADEIAGAFSSAITGIVTGTGTVEEAFSQLFSNIGKAFIDLASQVLAQRLFLSVLGLFGGGGGSAFASSFELPGAGFPTSGFSFAEGGFVTGPTRALIGEGGSDEYVIPANKMTGAMQRYNAGARGEAVLKGASSTEQSGGVALMNQPTQINISGGVMQFNDTNYIRQDQVPAIVDQASRAGEARALRKLQQSPSARRKIGM
jgi:hypothetical protein